MRNVTLISVCSSGQMCELCVFLAWSWTVKCNLMTAVSGDFTKELGCFTQFLVEHLLGVIRGGFTQALSETVLQGVHITELRIGRWREGGEQVTLNVSITEGLTKVHLLGRVSKKLNFVICCHYKRSRDFRSLNIVWLLNCSSAFIHSILFACYTYAFRRLYSRHLQCLFLLRCVMCVWLLHSTVLRQNTFAFVRHYLLGRFVDLHLRTEKKKIYIYI